MPRERQQSVKSDSMVNGDGRSSNNGGGPGSVPPMPQHNQQQGGGGGRPNFATNQGQNETDLAELFSPVSESSNVAQGLFDDGGGGGGGPRIPMSPFSGGGGGGPPGGGGMMGGMPPQQLRPPHSQPGGGGMYSMPPHQQQGYLRPPQHHPPPGGFPPGHPAHFPPGHPMHHAAQLQMMGGGPGGGMGGGGPPGGMGGAKIYPSNQPMVFNSTNPNAPPIYPCGVCHREIHDSDQAILCESGCNFWFHRMCTGLSDLAYIMLTKEVYAEWVCEKCLSSGNIPLVKMKS